WNNVIKPVFTFFGDAAGWLKDRWEGIGKFFSNLWNGVKKTFRNTVNWIIDKLNWLIDKANWLPGVDIDLIPKMGEGGGKGKGKKRKGMSTGGVLPGYAPGVDTIPAMLSPGEAVLVPEAVRMLGKDTILALNAIASRGRAGGRSNPRAARRGGFAMGGIAKKQPLAAAAKPAAPAKPGGGNQGGGGNFTVDQIILALQRLGQVAQTVITAITGLRNQLTALTGHVRWNWAAIANATTTTVTRIRTTTAAGFLAMRNAVVANLIALANSSRVQWFTIRQVAFVAWNAIRAHAVAQLAMLHNAARTHLNGIRAYSQWAMNAMRAHTAWAMNALRAHTAASMNAVRTHTAWSWNTVRSHLAATLRSVLSTLTSTWNRALNITRRTWAAIRNTIRIAWGQIQRDTFNTTQRMRVTQQNYQGFMSRSWASITNTIRNNVRQQQNHLRTLRTAMHHARVGMRQTADWAHQQFGRIKRASADPIRWTINNPFNEGLIRAWNRLNKDFNFGKRINKIVPHFAKGGPVPGKGNKDTQPAMLMPGEYVLSRKAIANMGGVGAVDRMHQSAREGSPAYNLGRKPSDAARKHRLMQRVPADDVGHFAFGGVQPHVARAGHEINRKFGPFPGGIGGVGSRPNASDHPKG